MTLHASQRTRRTAGLVGLLGAVGLLVTAKQLAGSPLPSNRLALTAPPTTATPTPAPPTTATATTVGGVRQITGDPQDNPFGTIQVSVTLSGGKVTDVTVLQSPNDRGRSVSIAHQALPLLREEVLQAQSAQIDVISGASYDSQGYAQSVQSALDKARA
ncbi:MAG: FMN-binding protein [Actinomycetota bacterium]|nr:FMN-binding protein [Actinomycetota bacterium]